MMEVPEAEAVVVISDWPSSTEGTLYAREGGRQWTINECSVSAKMQWAQDFVYVSLNYSFGIKMELSLSNSFFLLKNMPNKDEVELKALKLGS